MGELEEFSWGLIAWSVFRRSWMAGVMSALSLTATIADRTDSVALGFLVCNVFLFGASIAIGIYQPAIDAFSAGLRELKKLAEELP